MSEPAVERRVVVAIGLTQTLGWGSTFYLPAVIAGPLCAELSVSDAWFFGVFSAALFGSGLLGPIAGRIIDRQGGRSVLAATSLVFALGLVLLGLARGQVGLVLAWAVIGLGMGFGLYEAAFATVTALYGSRARSAITGITLLAGFASTVGWPVSTALIEAFGWRGACFVWAMVHLGFGLPVNRLVVPRLVRPVEVPAGAGGPGHASGTMLLLALVFGVVWFVATAMASHLPRLLQAAGASPGVAVLAASLMGPAQVAARLVEFSLLRRLPPLPTARVASGLHAVGAGLLLALGPIAAIPFVLLHGSGNGVMTIARGTLPLVLFGPAGYGFRSGVLGLPARLLQGVAPVAFGAVLEAWGPRAALVLTGSLMAAAAAGLCFVRQKE